MMHQFSDETMVISIVKDMFAGDLIFKKKYRNIYIYSTTYPDKIKKQIGRENYIEYLDCFLIVLPEKYELQSVIWEDFYLYYGDFYESMIDINNNINCIRSLSFYIQENIDMTYITNVLDYGCGSGLSVNIEVNYNLIGYEPNEKMRRQAVEKGMQVLDLQQFYSLPASYVDAVFSSYVFHMGIKEYDIEMLSRIIRKNGIIVANFYKGVNCLFVNDAFEKKGFNVKKVIGLDERFGCVYEYRKK